MVRDSKIDWITLLLYLLTVCLGWFNLYSISYEDDPSIINFNSHHGKQAVFILISLGVGIFILFLDTKFLEFLSYIVLGLSMVTLMAVLFMSKVGGASSWFVVGGIKIQPTEFAKVATLMALAKYMSRFNFSFNRLQDFLLACAAVAVPAGMVLLQNDAGSALVFTGLIFMLYREGLNPLFLVGFFVVGIVGIVSIMLSTTPGATGIIIAILIVLTAASAVFLALTNRTRLIVVAVGLGVFLAAIPLTINLVVKPYQSARIRVLVASDEQVLKEKKAGDHSLYNAGYQLRESLVAIGSGGISGKGFGNGTHTRGDFVPAEHTDYIYCVIGEEHGFMGSVTVLILYLLLLARIIFLAENSKSRYARVYGYGAASIIFMHVFVNVGMTIGLLPTIGIPLPFFSYGGSSVIAFSIMLFILMNHYSYRTNILN